MSSNISSALAIFATDIAEALVKAGNANVSSNILNYTGVTSDNTLTGRFKSKITDTSQRIQDIRSDVTYLERLGGLEFKAAQKTKGMWSYPEVRKIKKELVDEVDFQAKATPIQKIWRRIRGG